MTWAYSTRDRAGRGGLLGSRRPRGQGQTLLGVYPVPELRLVGADRPPRPNRPARSPAVLQYGIDYSFASRVGRPPVRWRPEAAIIVRLTDSADGLESGEPAEAGPPSANASPAVPPLAGLLGEVIGELHDLTGLDLRAGPPLATPIDVRAVPEQEIHVAFLGPAAAWLARVGPGPRPGVNRDRASETLASAGAWPGPEPGWYRRGWAIVGLGAVAADDQSCADEAIGPAATRVLLRHQLCHALGLGHAARPSLLMHQRVPLALGGYGRGDQHGLALVGRTRPDDHRAPGARITPERTFRCDC